jgi:hypothetical protein
VQQPAADGLPGRVAIVLDNQVVSAPEIQAVITGDAQISGIDRAAARRLAALIKHGALPFTFVITKVNGSDVAPGATGLTPSPASPATPTAGTVAAELTAAGYRRTSTGTYFAQELGREVATEQWKHTTDTTLPTVNLAEARPGGPGNPAITTVTYDNGVGTYRQFWCSPVARYAFGPAIDQARIARQLVERVTAEPVEAPNATLSMTSVDGSLICYMK